MATDPGEGGYADRLDDLIAQNPSTDFSGPGTVLGATATAQIISMEGPSEPLSDQQRLILAELTRAGASPLTLAQNMGTISIGGPAPQAPSTQLQPLPAGSGGLLPALPGLPRMDVAPPQLGTSRPLAARSLAIPDPEWALGLMPPGRIVFTTVINRQRSGVRFGHLPMVVWQNQTVASTPFSSPAGGGGDYNVLEP